MHAAANFAQLRDQVGMARTVEDADIDFGWFNAFGRRNALHIFSRRLGKVDHIGGKARANGKLVHVNIRRIQKPAFFRCGENRKRVGTGFGGDRRAFQRIERDVDFRTFIRRPADLFPDIEHRRFVAFALTDHHGPVHVKRIERTAHGFHRCCVSRFLIAAPDQLRRCHGRCFGHANHFKNQHAVNRILVILVFCGQYICAKSSVRIGSVHREFSPYAPMMGRGLTCRQSA